jgi:hypothetical protein
MLTFKEFKESLDDDEIKKTMEVVRKGMNLQGSGDFWDDFLSLCGNVEGMTALLGCPRESVTGLGGRIRFMKSRIEEQDSKSSGKDKMLKTGDKV